MQINVTPVIILHLTIVAICAFILAHRVRWHCTVVAGSVVVATAVSFCLSRITPTLSFAWDKCVWEPVRRLSVLRWSGGEFWLCTMFFWVLPVALASTVSILCRKAGFPKDHFPVSSLMILGMGIVVLSCALLWAIINCGRLQ